MAVIITCFSVIILYLPESFYNFTAMAAINELHEIIHFHRKKARLSRMELADLSGVGKTVIYDLENGKETVKWSTIQAVLTALNVKVKFESPLIDSYEKSAG